MIMQMRQCRPEMSPLRTRRNCDCIAVISVNGLTQVTPGTRMPSVQPCARLKPGSGYHRCCRPQRRVREGSPGWENWALARTFTAEQAVCRARLSRSGVSPVEGRSSPVSALGFFVLSHGPSLCQVTSHKSQVTSHKSQVTSHKSQVTRERERESVGFLAQVHCTLNLSQMAPSVALFKATQAAQLAWPAVGGCVLSLPSAPLLPLPALPGHGDRCTGLGHACA